MVVQDARPLDRDDASDEDDGSPVAPNWEPASRDADPASGSRGGGDILSMLVSIYGSKVRSLGLRTSCSVVLHWVVRYGYGLFEYVRFGFVRLCDFMFEYIGFGYVIIESVPLDSVQFDSVRFEYVRFDSVMLCLFQIL